jgi:hypothetical protein
MNSPIRLKLLVVNESLTLRGSSLKIGPYLFDVPKYRTIYMNSKNIIFTSVSYMVIHKLCNSLAPEQSLQTWNYWNMTKNLLRHLFCYLIGSISIDLTLWKFHSQCILSIIYNMIIQTCINSLILHSNIFHNGTHILVV